MPPRKTIPEAKPQEVKNNTPSNNTTISKQMDTISVTTTGTQAALTITLNEVINVIQRAMEDPNTELTTRYGLDRALVILKKTLIPKPEAEPEQKQPPNNTTGKDNIPDTEHWTEMNWEDY